jgi:hypothetical protein
MAAYTQIKTPPNKAVSPLHRITFDNIRTSSSLFSADTAGAASRRPGR